MTKPPIPHVLLSASLSSIQSATAVLTSDLCLFFRRDKETTSPAQKHPCSNAPCNLTLLSHHTPPAAPKIPHFITESSSRTIPPEHTTGVLLSRCPRESRQNAFLKAAAYLTSQTSLILSRPSFPERPPTTLRSRFLLPLFNGPTTVKGQRWNENPAKELLLDEPGS